MNSLCFVFGPGALPIGERANTFLVDGAEKTRAERGEGQRGYLMSRLHVELRAGTFR
jgi:hypothetical protein